MEQQNLIKDVSDTAIWVAQYRADETKRKDALFRDPFAQRLAGERGVAIAKQMKGYSEYPAWSLQVRTRLIDEFILKLIGEGVDVVVNLGAGLDARPYRMNLPAALKWIEVDYPHIIDYKKNILADDKPRCDLQSIAADLADRGQREQVLREVAGRGKKILVLTEGVIVYLTEEQVSELAANLLAHPSLCYWLTEYISPLSYRFLRDGKRARYMKNAPFLFFPKDWFGFFEKCGWVRREVRYLAEAGLQWQRPPPAPWWFFLIRPFIKKENMELFKRFSGYILFERPAEN